MKKKNVMILFFILPKSEEEIKLQSESNQIQHDMSQPPKSPDKIAMEKLEIEVADLTKKVEESKKEFLEGVKEIQKGFQDSWKEERQKLIDEILAKVAESISPKV